MREAELHLTLRGKTAQRLKFHGKEKFDREEEEVAQDKQLTPESLRKASLSFASKIMDHVRFCFAA